MPIVAIACPRRIISRTVSLFRRRRTFSTANATASTLGVPTSEQRKAFDDVGFVVCRSVINPAVVDATCRALDACFKGDFDNDGIYPGE